MRKLASIQIVDKIIPIDGADRIVLATLKGMGWQMIIKKDEVKTGEKVLFCEIDCALPIEPRFEFLRKSSYKRWILKDKVLKECFRLKTIKFRGALSQGLILPLSLFPEIKDKKVDEDVTELLGIQHYDELNATYGRASSGKSCNRIGNVNGDFPHFIRKTDQERIQNKMKYFDELKNVPFIAEAKYDGSSLTCYMVDKSFSPKQFGVCSRNFDLKNPNLTRMNHLKEALTFKCFPNDFIRRWKKRLLLSFHAIMGTQYKNIQSDYWNIINKLKVENALSAYFIETGKSIALQGEMVGPGINGNRDKYTETDWYVFDIYDVDNQKYLLPLERKEVIKKLNSYYEDVKIKEVDVINDNIYLFKEFTTLESLLKYVDRKTLRGNPLEGVVFKSLDPNKQLTFKCINNEYLLKEE